MFIRRGQNNKLPLELRLSQCVSHSYHVVLSKPPLFCTSFSLNFRFIGMLKSNLTEEASTFWDDKHQGSPEHDPLQEARSGVFAPWSSVELQQSFVKNTCCFLRNKNLPKGISLSLSLKTLGLVPYCWLETTTPPIPEGVAVSNSARKHPCDLCVVLS